MSHRKISIIGTGQVGMAIAFTLIIENLADELVLVDINKEKALGEVMDLNHSLPFLKPCKLVAGDYEDCHGSQIILITAGAKRAEGETRLDLLKRNEKIFSSLIPELTKHAPESIYVLVSNPVDIITYITNTYSDIPSHRILGTGTILDTARFRSSISEEVGMDVRNIHAFVLGEHGDSEVPVWSKANVYGHSIVSLLEERGLERESVAKKVRSAAIEVIKRKGATCYGVALGAIRIVEAILKDQKRVLTVSSLLTGQYGLQDVCLSLPFVLGKDGVESTIPLELSEEEHEKLQASAKKLKDTWASLQ